MTLHDRADVAGTQAALGDIAGQDHVAVHFEGHVLPRVHGNKSRHVGASVNLPDRTNLTLLPLGALIGPSISYTTPYTFSCVRATSSKRC